MRLLTHNLLCCLKCQSYPLTVEATDVAPAEAPFDADFVKRMLNRLCYSYLAEAFNDLRSKHIGLSGTNPLPLTIEEVDLSDNSAVLRDIHFAMNAVAIRNGNLRCPKCETCYQIVEYIPNMLVE